MANEDQKKTPAQPPASTPIQPAPTPHQVQSDLPARHPERVILDDLPKRQPESVVKVDQGNLQKDKK